MILDLLITMTLINLTTLMTQKMIQLIQLILAQMTILDQITTIPILLKNPKNNLNMRINLRSMKKRRPSMKRRREDLNNNILK